MLRIIALALVLVPSLALGYVDMRNANYSDTWIDLLVPGSGYDLKIRRTYNSRSLFNGMLGFGMCSNLETSIAITPEGNIKLTECGAGMQVLYTPRRFSSKAYKKTAARIVKLLKKKRPTMKAKHRKELRAELLVNENLRMQYAAELGMTSKTPNGTRFYANGKGVEAFTYKKGTYTRRLPDGSAQQFDRAGNMTRLIDKNGNFLKISYQHKRIRDITDRNGRKLNFSYYKNNKVKKISGPNNIKVSYKYDKLVDLVWVKMPDGSVYRYKYDVLHNLTKVTFPDKKTKSIRYDANKDWALGITDPDGCKESYKYQSSKKDPDNHYWSILTKKCEGKIVSKGRFEFWYKNSRKKGGKYLAKTAMNINGRKKEIAYDSTYGRPLYIVENGKKTKFSYYKDGLVKSKKIGKATSFFKYNKIRKVSQVRTGKLTTKFKYDKHGNLTYANNSRGQYVKLKYDGEGRISSIVDQARRRVNIAYESRFGKPRLVERPGVGAIKIAYKPTGAVKSVTPNKGGPTIAVQVASTFNNLLDIIAPAGVDLGI